MSKSRQARTSLTPIQERCITALVSSRNHREAAQSANVPERTVTAWLALPYFQDALKAARLAVRNETYRFIEGKVAEAAQTIVDLMNSEETTDAIQFRAATELLDRVGLGKDSASESEAADANQNMMMIPSDIFQHMTTEEKDALQSLLKSAEERKEEKAKQAIA